MTDPSIERRLSSLEREVARLKVRTRTMLPKSQWVSAIIGTAKDDPIYEEIWKLGKQIRDAEEGGSVGDSKTKRSLRNPLRFSMTVKNNQSHTVFENDVFRAGRARLGW